jgi:hypothetical protein
MSIFGNLHWYFVGYERQIQRDEKGRSRGVKLVYTGRYYTYSLSAEERTRFKLVSLALALLLTMLYLISSLCDWARTYANFVSVVNLVNLVPLIYLWVGVVSLQMTRPQMTYREMIGSSRRARNACVACVVVSALTLGMDLINLAVQYKLHILATREWVFFLLMLCILTCSAVLKKWIENHPGDLVPEGEETV